MDEWLGKGVKFPNIFNNGKTDIAKYIDKVNQSIFMILSTPIGTRFFLPSYGSRLYELLFESNDLILKDMLEYYTYDALYNWEKRIKVIKVEAEVTDSAIATVNIYYQLNNSNIQQHYVYPFNRSIKELD